MEVDDREATAAGRDIHPCDLELWLVYDQECWAADHPGVWGEPWLDGVNPPA
ncbi:MAG: hypothetical protein JO240_15045 [Solirubrobacterales bacterium]|nr:hypothetical protein [Solirubrobacterales bacterium]